MMKVLRKAEIENPKTFKVGDQITVELEGIGTFTATAQMIDPDGTLFFMDDCVADRPMNEKNTNKGGFLASDLCKWMNTELLAAFPEEIRSRMFEDKDGNMLSIPTRAELFGHDEYSDRYEDDDNEQLPLMKERKNRICNDPDGNWDWYWLMNARTGSASGFADVSRYGFAYYSRASDSGGVRPVFLIA